MQSASNTKSKTRLSVTGLSLRLAAALGYLIFESKGRGTAVVQLLHDPANGASTPLVGWAEARKRCRRLKPYENAHMQGFAYHFLHSIVSEKKFSTSKTLAYERSRTLQ